MAVGGNVSNVEVVVADDGVSTGVLLLVMLSALSRVGGEIKVVNIEVSVLEGLSNEVVPEFITVTWGNMEQVKHLYYILLIYIFSIIIIIIILFEKNLHT